MSFHETSFSSSTSPRSSSHPCLPTTDRQLERAKQQSLPDLNSKVTTDKTTSKAPPIRFSSSSEVLETVDTETQSSAGTSKNSQTSPISLSKSSSSSELEAVNVPDDPRLFDIYSLSSGQVYHQLPSLLTNPSVMDQNDPEQQNLVGADLNYSVHFCQFDYPCGKKGCRTCDGQGALFEDSDSDISVRSLPRSEYSGVHDELPSSSGGEPVNQENAQHLVVDLSSLGLPDPDSLERWLSSSEASTSSTENRTILESILSGDDRFRVTGPSFEQLEDMIPHGSQTLHLKVSPKEEFPGPCASSQSTPRSSSPIFSSPCSPNRATHTEEDQNHTGSDKTFSSQSSDRSFIVLRVEVDERPSTSTGPMDDSYQHDNLHSMDDREEDVYHLSESWVDLSRSDSPTPAHPDQLVLQAPSNSSDVPCLAPEPPLAPSPTPPSLEGEGGEMGTRAAAVRLRRSTRPLTAAMDCPPVPSSSLGSSSPFVQPSLSSSFSEQYDSVGPLAAPNRGVVVSFSPASTSASSSAMATASSSMMAASSSSAMAAASSSAMAAPSSSAMAAAPKDGVEGWYHGFANGEEYLRLLKEAQRESNHSSARVSLASSRRDSPRGSPRSPPNSPNPEPAGEGGAELDHLGAVPMNYYCAEEGSYIRLERNRDTDWIWDWSSRPDQQPPAEWRFSHPNSSNNSNDGNQGNNVANDGNQGNNVANDGNQDSNAANAADFSSSMLSQPDTAEEQKPLRPIRHGASLRHVMLGKSALFSKEIAYTILLTNVFTLVVGTGIGMWLKGRTGGTVTITTVPLN